jgi:hypothetical protein
MADTAAARLTAAAGRRFAFTLALGFGALALVLWWRDRQVLTRVALMIAGLLVVSGLLVPTHLGPVERAWARFGMALGRITAPLFIAVVYWLVITPFGIARRTFGRSPVHHRPADGSFWITRIPDTRDPRDRMTRQF